MIGIHDTGYVGPEIIDRQLNLWIHKICFPCLSWFSDISICLHGDWKEALHQDVSACLWFWHFIFWIPKFLVSWNITSFPVHGSFLCNVAIYIHLCRKRIYWHLGVKIVKNKYMIGKKYVTGNILGVGSSLFKVMVYTPSHTSCYWHDYPFYWREIPASKGKLFLLLKLKPVYLRLNISSRYHLCKLVDETSAVNFTAFQEIEILRSCTAKV